LATWDWQVFCKETTSGEVSATCFGKGGDITYLDWLLSAWGWTLSVSVLALLVALFFGSLMGILRTTPHRGLVLLGNAWTELFRNIPLLVQIFLWYHVVPSLFPVLRGVPSFVLVVIGLGLFTSARISEQVRAGIQALAGGQRMAGMAYRIIIPPLTSESMNIIKNSSVAFAVSISELTLFALQAQEETSRGVEVYLAVTGLYFISAFAINRAALFIENRVRVPGMIGGGGH
jgi:glutamate/aspartate transport system permease protein